MLLVALVDPSTNQLTVIRIVGKVYSSAVNEYIIWAWDTVDKSTKEATTLWKWRRARSSEAAEAAVCPPPCGFQGLDLDLLKLCRSIAMRRNLKNVVTS